MYKNIVNAMINDVRIKDNQTEFFQEWNPVVSVDVGLWLFS